jgi:molybdopterin synthase catalytic subunit
MTQSLTLTTNKEKITMTIDELIKELEKIKEEHGNLDVVIYHRFDERDSYFKADDVDIMVDDDKNIIYL